MKKNTSKFNLISNTQPLTSRHGFTLIEVLVAATIIGVLTMIGVVSFQQALKKSRDGRRKSDLASIQSALEIYRTDHGEYPTSGTIPVSGSWADASGNVYMKNFPADPRATSYIYYYSSNNTTYDLCALLESKGASDPNCAASVSCGTANCNYGVTNP